MPAVQTCQRAAVKHFLLVKMGKFLTVLRLLKIYRKNNSICEVVKKKKM